MDLSDDMFRSLLEHALSSENRFINGDEIIEYELCSYLKNPDYDIDEGAAQFLMDGLVMWIKEYVELGQEED